MTMTLQWNFKETATSIKLEQLRAWTLDHLNTLLWAHWPETSGHEAGTEDWRGALVCV